MKDKTDEIVERDEMVGANTGYRTPENTDHSDLDGATNSVNDGGDEETGSEGDEGADGEFPPKGSEELEKEREEMQKLFSGRMEEVANLRMRASVMDKIDANPEAMIRGLATQYGIDLTPKEVKESKKEIDLEGLTPGKEESLPKFIARVMDKILDSREQKTQKVQPAQAEISPQDQAKKTIEYIRGKFSDWGVYEKRMTELVTKHPSLFNDPDELYKLAKGSFNNPGDKANGKKANSKAVKKNSGERGGSKVATTPKGKKVPFNIAWDRAMREANK